MAGKADPLKTDTVMLNNTREREVIFFILLQSACYLYCMSSVGDLNPIISTTVHACVDAY